jgi:hypothetical protein
MSDIPHTPGVRPAPANEIPATPGKSPPLPNEVRVIPDVTSLAATVPVLLVPIRIETRFVGAAAEGHPNLIDRVAVPPALLLLRVYPDTISTTSFEPELTADEVTAGTTYWQQAWATSDDSLAAWRVLAAAYGSTRAAWIVQTMAPTNLANRPATGDTPAPSFSTPATRASSYEQTPTATMLPDAWTVVLERKGAVRTVTGSPISGPLAVGLTPHDGTFPDGLPVDAGMRWLVDFGEAERVGMGIRIELSAAEASGGFDRILVFGLRDAAADQPGDQALAQVISDHHYTDGIALVPQGAPTNNTTDASSAYTTADPDHSVSYRVELGADLATDPAADGNILATALGLPAETFSHVRFADGHGCRNGRDMMTALWPATFGYFLTQMMDPEFSAAQVETMRAFSLAMVVPRGPLPALRIGATPYGVLPTTSLTALQRAPAAEGTAGARALLSQLLARLQPAWTAGVPSAPHIGATADPDQDFVSVLTMDASSIDARGRRVLGDDALWNTATLIDPSGPPGTEWWLEHLVNGQNTLDSLGLASWHPRVIHTAIGRDSYPVPYSTILDSPLSETDSLPRDATLNNAPVNYIEWLAHAPMTDVWMDAYPGPHPTSILYRILRQSILLEYVTQAGNAQVANGTLASSALREVELVDMDPSVPTLTARDIVNRPVSAGAGVTWAEYLDTVTPTPESPLARLADLRSSMDRLATLPTAELDRLLMETLDAASHRIDPWITALSWSLLADLRGGPPVSPALHLGAYGWVEGVRPATPQPVVTGADTEAVVRLDEARGVARTQQPARLPCENSGGFVQAPSVTQAAAAAVLRSGYLSHRGTTDEQMLAIDLSSTRTNAALWLLAGVRQGLSLGALTGYQFEQKLHEQNLNIYIQPFRDAYPLVADELTGATANGAVLPPPQVVDGEKVRAAWQSGVLTPGAIWGAGLPTSVADQAAVVAMLETIDDMLSALSDVSIAESVYQILRGNYGRVGGILDAVSRGDHPPDPDIVATPRPGLDVTHRLMLLLAGPPPVPVAWSSVTARPRAILEPWLSDWVGSRLPDPVSVRAFVSWTAVSGNGSAVVTLRDLDVGPLDVLSFADAGIEPQRAELEQRLLFAAAVPPDSATVNIRYDETSLPAGSVTFPDFLTAARAMRDIIGASRPLDLAAFALPDKTPTTGRVDLAELGSRVSALTQALDSDITALSNALAALQATKSNAANAATVREALLSASGYGVSGAIPSASATADALIAQATSVLAELNRRHGAISGSSSTLADLMADAESVLGASAVALPHLAAPNAASVQAAFGQSAELKAIDPQAVRRWILQLSHVRPAVRRLDLAFATTRLLGATVLSLDLAQLPITPGDRWLGLPLDPSNPPSAGRVAIEAVSVGEPSTATVYAGLLVDEWLERIPSDTTTAGVAFHFDEPLARAPQVPLLALCPDGREAWDLDLVRTILGETLDLAKARAVDLNSRQDLGQILPALYFPFNLEGATPATHFLERLTNADQAVVHISP